MFKFLAGKDKEILASINGITLSREDIAKFGDVVHDHSPIHRDIEVARKFGFEDTPVIGVHSAAIGGRLSKDLLSVMQGDKTFYFTNSSVTLRDPIYPEEPINWIIDNEQGDEESRSYRLVVPHSNPELKSRVELVAEFRTTRPSFIEHNIEKFVYSENIEFTQKEIREYYEGLRENPLREVAFSHGIARIPSTLLSFVGDLNKFHGTDIGGKNITMKSSSYDEISVGKGVIDIYEVEKKGRGNKVFYTFQGVLYQNGKPILESEVKTLANGELDVRALRSHYGLSE